MPKLEDSVNIVTCENQPDESQEHMLRAVESIKVKFGSKVSIATILAVLQQNPCLLRCITDIKSPTYGDDIDPLYLAKHEYARICIVDRITQEFCADVAIGAEHPIKTGKLDVAITNSRIVLNNGNRIVGIEVKSGRSIDIFQLIRYLQEVDILIIARVPTRDVVILKKSDIASEIDRLRLLLQKKATQINAGHQYKVEGPWCYECMAECEYRKTRFKHVRAASMEGLSDFINDVGTTVEKTVAQIRQELAG